MNSVIATTLLIMAICLHRETLGQPTGGKPFNEQEATASSRTVVDTCKSFATTVKTLAEFSLFERHYRQVTECLHRDPIDLCQVAEETCESQGILWPNINSLGKLIDELRDQRPVCHLEYASRVYRLHQQLVPLEQPNSGQQVNYLGRILRALANRVAAKCQSSLVERLIYVDKAAPDTMKHISFIVGLTGVSEDKLARLPVEVGQYTPILEGEQVMHPRDSALTGGFEFKLAVKVGLDAVRKSCAAMKMYHLNLLGSLGLLASVGYGASPGSAKSLQEEAPGDAARIRIWLLSAVICQSLKTVVKVSSMNTEGKLTNRIMVLPVQEFDLSSQDEFDNEFSNHRLPEGIRSLALDEPNDALDTFVYDNRQINLRKLQLLYGPGYRMANALLSYLDISRPNRLLIPYGILAKQVPDNLNEDNNDDDDD